MAKRRHHPLPYLKSVIARWHAQIQSVHFRSMDCVLLRSNRSTVQSVFSNTPIHSSTWMTWIIKITPYTRECWIKAEIHRHSLDIASTYDEIYDRPLIPRMEIGGESLSGHLWTAVFPSQLTSIVIASCYDNAIDRYGIQRTYILVRVPDYVWMNLS